MMAGSRIVSFLATNAHEALLTKQPKKPSLRAKLLNVSILLICVRAKLSYALLEGCVHRYRKSKE